MLTNWNIIDDCDALAIPLVGVFSKNCLPTQLYEGGYVINLEDDKDEHGNFLPGTHWTAIYIEQDNKKQAHACYFDSFGFPPPIAVDEFLAPFTPFAYSTNEIQNIESGWCGHYCIFFLWYMTKNRKREPVLKERYSKFLHLFDAEHPQKNLTLLKDYLGIK